MEYPLLHILVSSGDAKCAVTVAAKRSVHASAATCACLCSVALQSSRAFVRQQALLGDIQAASAG